MYLQHVHPQSPDGWGDGEGIHILCHQRFRHALQHPDDFREKANFLEGDRMKVVLPSCDDERSNLMS